MRALAIASGLFSVFLFTLSGALARASDPPVVAVGPNGQSRAPAQTRDGASADSTVAVTASKAVGLRIASIRINTRGVAKSRRLGVLVTVRDRLGRATFRLRLGAHVTARRIALAVTARTPKVQARKLVTVRLPKPAT